jgi:hypothetical protein
MIVEVEEIMTIIGLKIAKTWLVVSIIRNNVCYVKLQTLKWV